MCKALYDRNRWDRAKKMSKEKISVAPEDYIRYYKDVEIKHTHTEREEWMLKVKHYSQAKYLIYSTSQLQITNFVFLSLACQSLPMELYQG